MARYSRAIELSGRTTPSLQAVQILPVYEGRSLVWRSLSQYDRAIADLKIVRQLTNEEGNLRKEGESLCDRAYTHWLMFSGEQVPFVVQVAQGVIQLATKNGDEKILARSLSMLGAVDQGHQR